MRPPSLSPHATWKGSNLYTAHASERDTRFEPPRWCTALSPVPWATIFEHQETEKTEKTIARGRRREGPGTGSAFPDDDCSYPVTGCLSGSGSIESASVVGLDSSRFHHHDTTTRQCTQPTPPCPPLAAPLLIFTYRSTDPTETEILSHLRDWDTQQIRPWKGVLVSCLQGTVLYARPQPWS